MSLLCLFLAGRVSSITSTISRPCTYSFGPPASVHYGCAALWVMDLTQVTLDRWLDLVTARSDRDDEFIALLNNLLTALDEIDKSLVAIAGEISSLA